MSLDTFDQLSNNTGHDSGKQANTSFDSPNDVASDQTFRDACGGSKSNNPASKKLIIGVIAAALVGGAGYFASMKLETTPKAIKSDSAVTSAPQQVVGAQQATVPNNVGVAAIPGGATEPASAAAAAVSTETMKWEATALKRKIESDLVNTAWPEDKKDCRFLERSDAYPVKGMEILQAVCRQAGAQLYFKCSPTGLRWDPTIPGCEVK